MSGTEIVDNDNSNLISKISEIEERLDIIHDGIRDMNSAIDMLVRFSITAKAFMELSISQGIIDPNELNKLASKYDSTYSSHLNIPESQIELEKRFENNLY